MKRRNSISKWEQYEKAKGQLQKMKLSPAEYQKELQKLARRLGL